MIAPEKFIPQLDVAAEAEPAPEPELKTIPEDVPLAPLPETLLTREWLVTNGLGGYASGTLSGVPTRRYPRSAGGGAAGAAGAACSCWARCRRCCACRTAPSSAWGGEQLAGQQPVAPGAGHLKDFRMDWGLPVWTYEAGAFRLEKRVLLAHRQNTVYVFYRLMAGEGEVRLEIHPTVHFPAPRRAGLDAARQRLPDHRGRGALRADLAVAQPAVAAAGPRRPHAHFHRVARGRSKMSTTASRIAAATSR